jgi:hypothetical protein
LLGAAKIFHFFPFQKKPYLCVPVEFTAEQIPYTKVQIEGVDCSLMVDLGSVSECWLRKDLLDTMTKTFSQNVLWINLHGKIRETREYTIPKLKVQSSWIRDIITCEEEYDPPTENTPWLISQVTYDKNGKPLDGRIGWQFLTSFYPLFDLGHSKFFFTRGPKTLPKLEKMGYPMHALTQIPFEINFIGCVVTLDTPLGKKRFLLDTGTSKSLIQANLFNTDERSVVLDQLGFGSYIIPQMELLRFPFVNQLQDIDGILGMDFFSKHLVYLDFKQRVALIGSY